MTGDAVVQHLAAQWRAAGVAEGDVLLVHSNLTRTFKTCLRAGMAATPDLVLDSFLAALGSSGTLLLPLFNFDFTQGVPFDLRTTPSKMGAMTEAARLRPGAVRTGHPVYSFAVLGRQAQAFHGLDNESPFGAGSPFEILTALDGAVSCLDLPDFDSMTYYHHVEEMKQVPYRVYKSFTGAWTGLDGVTTEKTYRLFVRRDGVRTETAEAEARMWARGIYRGDPPKVGSGLRVARAKAMFDYLGDIIDSGRALGLMYSVDPAV